MIPSVGIINSMSSRKLGIGILDNLQTVLGLTKNESKVYKVLIENPDLDTAALASKTDLPRTRIYEILSKLAAKNLLEKQAHGSGYSVIPPTTAIKNYIQTIDEEHNHRKILLNEISEYMQKVYMNRVGLNISPGVSILPFKDAELSFLSNLNNIKSRLYIAVSSSSQSIDWKKSGTVLASNYTNDLDIRYLISSVKVANRISHAFGAFTEFKHLNIKFKWNSEVYTSFIILDNTVYIFFLGQQENTSLETLVLQTSSEGLLHSFEWMFDSLWDKGNQIDKKSQ